jgi:hypothetical protein
MSLPELNIELQGVSDELTADEYWTVEDVCWADGSWILNCRGCPMSPWELNIELWRVSNELTGVEYWTAEGVRSAQGSWILNCGGCPLSSPELNIELRRVSVELMGVEYWALEGVWWAHCRWNSIVEGDGEFVLAIQCNPNLGLYDDRQQSKSTFYCLFVYFHWPNPLSHVWQCIPSINAKFGWPVNTSIWHDWYVSQGD